MTAKEKAVVQEFINEANLYEQVQRDAWKELGEMYVTRGGAARPSCSLVRHFDFLQTCADRESRDRAKIIWTQYYEAQAQIDARNKLGAALANLR